MLRRCLFCLQSFGENTIVEAFPGARRMAYDPARGRLWAVCPRCSRWSLAPIESRWEALESLEKATRDDARLLGQTENVGLFAIGDARIIRVGQAGLREESWWRYSREVAGRRKQARRIIGRGKVKEAIVMLLLTGFPIWGIRSPQTWIDRARRRQFGRFAWKGEAACDRCGRTRQRIPLGAPLLLDRDLDSEGRFLLRGYCSKCRRSKGGRFTIPARATDPVLRRGLAWFNFSGVTDTVLDDAVADIDRAGTATRFLDSFVRREISIRKLTEEASIALEIAVNDVHERQLLTAELDELEARWREEEEIAAIVDRELT